MQQTSNITRRGVQRVPNSGEGDAAREPGEPVRVAFLLVPQFPLMGFSSAIEPLRSANLVSGTTLYEWHLTSLDGQPVVASNGISIPVAGSLEMLARPDMLVVCVGLEPLAYATDRRLLHPLRALSRHGCRIGAISGGSFVLAEAGLLVNRRATVHWQYLDLFRLRYPTLEVRQDLYVVDRDVFTCSGGTAAMDLMLYFVGEQCGAEVALAVAEQFIHPQIRPHKERQRMDRHARYQVRNPRLVSVIEMMEGSLAEPMSLQRIADRAGLSTRQMQRLFHEHIGKAPAPFYLQLRLERARTLILETTRAIGEVALECGFTSTSHFCNAYKRVLGRTPSDERRHLRRRATHEAAPAPSPQPTT
jgi:AraC family transcriptional regulator, glycine betaine-responsive activator